MANKPLFAILALLMLAVIIIPAMPVKAWEYQDGTPRDTKYEEFGPRADKLLIKLYASELSEFDALAAGEIDVTDWALTEAYYNLFATPPLNETINTIFYDKEYAFFMLDTNNNNNEFLGNPPNPMYSNPVYPNPCSVWEMRKAIEVLTDRRQLDTIIGSGFFARRYLLWPDWDIIIPPPPPPPPEELLEAGGFTLTNSPDGWRYWDLNGNSVKDLGEDLELMFVIRGDDSCRREFGVFICDQLEQDGVKVKCNRVFGSSETAKLQVVANKDFHLYIGYWNIGPDLDFLYNWNWDSYWHPGRCVNYAGINDPDYNMYSRRVLYAKTLQEAEANATLAGEVFKNKVLSIPLWSFVGNKGMSRFYTGGNNGQPVTPDDGENAYRGQYWEGAVSVDRYGVDSFTGFLNMHPQGYERGNGEMTIRYGFKVSDIKSHNPVYAEWLWDQKLLSLQYDSLLTRNPYNPTEFTPWLAKAFEIGTYNHPVYGTCSKIRFTMQPNARWSDGVPITVADVHFTLVELDSILEARGLPPPHWISNLASILAFKIFDPYNFEVLLNANYFFAAKLVSENLILPEHIWKPLAESGDIEDVDPDSNMISSGPYRYTQYEEYSHVLLVANKPGSIVKTDIPGSIPIESPYGYYKFGAISFCEDEKQLINYKVDYYTQPIVRTFSIENLWYGGNLSDNCWGKRTYQNGTEKVTGPWTINLNASGQPGDTYTYTITETVTGLVKVEYYHHVYSPSELASWGNGTHLLWITIKEDIVGSTLYDQLGLDSYPFKSQLPSPDIKVDMKDIAVVAKAFGSYPSHPIWNPYADVNDDYKIDIKDVAAIAKKFGWTG